MDTVHKNVYKVNITYGSVGKNGQFGEVQAKRSQDIF